MAEDKKASYRLGTHYDDDEQPRRAEDTIVDVRASGLWPGKVVTEVTPAGPVWEAPPEHPDCVTRSPNDNTHRLVRPGRRVRSPAQEVAH
jgi:peptide-methionine (S)-S-oxide reductase